MFFCQEKIIYVQVKKGPEKGKVYEVVKRKLEMKLVGSVSLRFVNLN